MKLSYPYKIAFSALIFLLAAGGLVFLMILPEADKIKLIKDQTEIQAAQTEKDYAEGRSLKKVAANLKIIEPRLPELKKTLIEKGADIDFITALEKTADKNNVIVKTSLGAEAPLADFCAQIPLRLESRGNFSDQIGFLAELESLNYYLNFKSLILEIDSLAPATGSTPSLRMILAADTYWQKQ